MGSPAGKAGGCRERRRRQRSAYEVGAEEGAAGLLVLELGGAARRRPKDAPEAQRLVRRRRHHRGAVGAAGHVEDAGLVAREFRDLLHAPRAQVPPHDELVVREAVRRDKLLVVHRPLHRAHLPPPRPPVTFRRDQRPSPRGLHWLGSHRRVIHGKKCTGHPW